MLSILGGVTYEKFIGTNYKELVSQIRLAPNPGYALDLNSYRIRESGTNPTTVCEMSDHTAFSLPAVSPSLYTSILYVSYIMCAYINSCYPDYNGSQNPEYLTQPCPQCSKNIVLYLGRVLHPITLPNFGSLTFMVEVRVSGSCTLLCQSFQIRGVTRGCAYIHTQDFLEVHTH